ncbi:MAG: hypothetical protein V4510_08105 [bacterium]
MARVKAPERPQSAPASPAASAPKPTVVLRAGPSRRKGLLVDIATGLVGVMLIVGAVVLVDALPKTDYPPNQFKVSFTTATTNLTAQSHRLSETEQNYDFSFEVTEDDVYQVDLMVNFTDDLKASLPDKFRYEIRRPDGEPAETRGGILVNGLAQLKAGSNTEYESTPASGFHSVTMTPKPQDAIVKAIQGATASDVVQALEKKNHLLTKGTWKVHVTLDSAGDCPSVPPPTVPPSPPTDDDLKRISACQQDAQAHGTAGNAGKEDTGNSFTVGVFSYTRFVVNAECFPDGCN